MSLHKSIESEVEQMLGDLLLTGKDSVVIVEDRKDVAFWSEILGSVLPVRKFDFAIEVMSKDVALMYVSYTDERLIICVDSDNDHLHRSDYSKYLSPRSKYLFHTHTHSKENHFVHPPNLAFNFLESVQQVYNFEADLASASRAVLPWVKLWLFCTDKANFGYVEKNADCKVSLAWKTLENLIKTAESEISTLPVTNMTDCSLFFDKISESVHQFEVSFWDSLKSAKELNAEDKDRLFKGYAAFDCPVSDSNAIWFVQGHIVFDDIIVPHFIRLVKLYAEAEMSRNPKEQARWKGVLKRVYENYTLLSRSYSRCLLQNVNCLFIEDIRNDILTDFSR
jgi:Protein of unknown function (DUF4435)